MKKTKDAYQIHSQEDMVPPNNPPTFTHYESDDGKNVGVIAERRAEGRTTHFHGFGRFGNERDEVYTGTFEQTEEWLKERLK